MSWIGVAVGGGAVAGAVISSNASSNAASTEANAANNANATQLAEFNTEQGETQPYRAAGTQALGQLQGDLSSLTAPFNPNNLQNTPGYQFQLQQGEQALQRSAASRGLLNSTGTMQSLDAYSQNMAGTEYQQALSNYMAQNQQTYGMLSGMANLGLAGTGQSVQAGMNYANQSGSNTIQAGNAAAAGTVGVANAYSNGLSGLASAGALYGLYGSSTPSPGGTVGGTMPALAYTSPTVGSL